MMVMAKNIFFPLLDTLYYLLNERITELFNECIIEILLTSDAVPKTQPPL